MKVLVTGAAGFIGGQLWHKLWQRGDEVVGIDNFSYGNMDNLKFDDHDFGAEVRKMDIRDKAGMLQLFEEEKFEVVYNIAGIAPAGLPERPCAGHRGQYAGPCEPAGGGPPHRHQTARAGIHQRYV